MAGGLNVLLTSGRLGGLAPASSRNFPKLHIFGQLRLPETGKSKDSHKAPTLEASKT